MKKGKKGFLFFLLVTFISVHGQGPDSITVKLENFKDVGELPVMFTGLSDIYSGGYPSEHEPEIKGIPDSLDKMMVSVAHSDFLQHIYQVYHKGLMSKEEFEGRQTSWNWYPEPGEYIEEFVNVYTPVAAGFDKDGNVKLIIDQNNNLDLSDDTVRTVIPDSGNVRKPGLEKENIYKVYFENFDGNKIVKDSSRYYISYKPGGFFSERNGKIGLVYTNAILKKGSFVAGNDTMMLALHTVRPVQQDGYEFWIWKKGEEPSPGFNLEGESVEINGSTYVPGKLNRSLDSVVLKKINGGNGIYISQTIPDFDFVTIFGDTLNTKEFRGKYVLLDFWGTWCGPCVAEVPKLKEIYEKYGTKNFTIIGLANDNEKKLKEFVIEKNINWPQSVQGNGSEILKMFKIKGYPTTFLLDPEGKIIEKNIRAQELESRLEEILTKK